MGGAGAQKSQPTLLYQERDRLSVGCVAGRSVCLCPIYMQILRSNLQMGPFVPTNALSITQIQIQMQIQIQIHKQMQAEIQIQICRY